MKTISIICGKLFILIGKIFKRGSVLPGAIAIKIDKNLLKKIKLPKNVIAVTGSSGKGSTSSVIVKILRDQGYSVTYNNQGSNLINGITTSILKDVKLNGKLKTDYLVMEIDERYTKYIFKDIKPTYVIITNICRDQPPRQGHFDIVSNDIKLALTNDMKLILNGDDPYLRMFGENAIYYGIEFNKYSYKENMFMNLNINYCPKCSHKLEYNYYNFENNGDYYCPNCDFKRPIIKYKATNIDYQNNIVEINNKYNVDMGYNILFSIYNTLAAFTLSLELNLDIDKTINTIKYIKRDNKIYSIYPYKNRTVHVLNNKNENNSTFNQSLLYVDRYKDEKVIVIGWKEISRRYNFDDISWLYDIDFEILARHKINKIICVGINRYDIASRISLANINNNLIETFENLDEACKYIKEKTNGNIYAILNFDYVKPFNKLMEENDDN